MSVSMPWNWKEILKRHRAQRVEYIEHLTGKAMDDVEFTLFCIYKHEISQIDKAIDKCEDGEYGRCERCGKAISLERLNILPWTPLCTECAHGDSGSRWNKVR